jgi:putative membrane protein
MPFLLAAFFALVLAVAGSSQAPAQSQAEFLNDVIQINLGMIAIGELAGARSQDARVRALGREMAEHYSRANNLAAAIAISVGSPRPAEPRADGRETYGRLTELSGQAFDRSFLDYVIGAHEAMLQSYKAWAADTGPVGNFAKSMAPEIEEHLKTAEALSG